MKIPLVYPKMHDTKNFLCKNCVAFEKLDGTNMHFVFEDGFFRFQGTRRNRYNFTEEGYNEFNKNHPELKDAFDDNLYLFMDLEKTIRNKYSHAKQIILFMEYYGEKSFAGTHQEDDVQSLYLFDAQIDGRMLPPEEFLLDFKDYSEYVPKIIYKGKYSGQLVEDIRKGKYPVNEGVVIKGVHYGKVCMAKVKTDAYMEKLKNKFKDDWENYWE